MTLTNLLFKYNIKSLMDLVRVIKEQGENLPIELVYQAAEYLNPNKDLNSAYFTNTFICHKIMEELPDFTDKKHITILEPSAGAGNFIPFIAEKYRDKEVLEIFLVDIDEDELKIAELIFETYYRKKYPNIAIIYIHDDYLKFPISGKKFDLVIGNPPYAKINDLALIKEYRKHSIISKSSNLFCWFIEKALRDGNFMSLIVPKSVLNAPEYFEIRQLMISHCIMSIIDFGELGFDGVKIETINLIITTDRPKSSTHVISMTHNIDIYQEQDYITDSKYPTWLLYRNESFDNFADSMILGVFDTFRDRQIVNSMLHRNGKYRVLKSRNIGINCIINIQGYDAYINDIETLAVAKFLNKKNVVMIPNLSYVPRACFLPKNTIVNGSVALLTLKTEKYIITEKDLELFSTEEFSQYYRIARNYGTRSLNIDKNSVFFFGIRR